MKWAMTVQIIDCVQGEPDWLEARLGLPTASEFKSVLAKGEGKVRRAYLLRLAAEILTGEVAESYTNQHMERGKENEAELRSEYAFLNDVEPQIIGFVHNGPKGCSPDSFIGDSGMLEIKSALPHIVIEKIIKDNFPPEHVAQCQGGLWVCEREWIDIAVGWPKLPLFVKRAYRDEDYIANLSGEVDRFNDELAATVETIRRYGGETPAKSLAHRQLEESVNIIGAV